tara:strand:+ start:117 stop:467 length:351 start_codon:yes stop_codon:yes gene_type:complete
MKPIERRVAEAIVKHSSRAGQAWSVTEPQTEEERAENLLRPTGRYKAYIVGGDPYGWVDGNAAATILMEPKGTKDDCEIPLEYYGNGFDVSCKASEELGDHHIEFVNAAVAVVYPS